MQSIETEEKQASERFGYSTNAVGLAFAWTAKTFRMNVQRNLKF